MNKKRVTCALIPNFSIALRHRQEPQLCRQPLVIMADSSDLAPVVAVNTVAAEAALSIGMTIAQTETLCHNVAIRVRNSTEEIEQSNMIFKKLQSLSPFVEEAALGRFFIDTAGLTLLYKTEQQFAERIISIVRPFDLPVKVGIAKNKFIASVAAEISLDNNSSIIPDGHERKFIREMSVSRLPVSTETASMLHDLGLKTIRQIAAIPANEMTLRFGPEGTALAHLARGGDISFFLPEFPEEILEQSIHLTFPIHNERTVILYVGKLLEPLLNELGKLSQGCSSVTITLGFENKTCQTLSVAIEQPSLKLSAFLRQLSLTLEKTKLLDAVTDIRVVVPHISNLNSEQLTFASGEPSVEQSLQEVNSPARIYLARLQPSILPERKFIFFSALDKPERKQPLSPDEPFPASYSLGNISGLRLLQPPPPVRVIVEDDRISHLWHNSKHPVTAWHGPWELSGGWWSESFNRLYYELLVTMRRNSGPGRFLVFYDRLLPGWFLQGIFD